MKRLLLAAAAILATTGIASAEQQVCQGWLKFGHGSNSNTVFVRQDIMDEAYKHTIPDDQCWFDADSKIGKRILDRCGDTTGGGSGRTCTIVGQLRWVRGGYPQIIAVTRIDK